MLGNEVTLAYFMAVISELVGKKTVSVEIRNGKFMTKENWMP
jgi:hypothetical protein